MSNKIDIPKESVLANMINIDGYKFYLVGTGSPQCATCMEHAQVIAAGEEKENGKVTRLILNKECNCERQK